ncbi:C-reactive protein 1.4-like [Porites lutea]|uniref:C-reactive protein 1.4-like n=1 Tax=Porites lutea TaxID=51062 RepID=UPI003CC647A7
MSWIVLLTILSCTYSTAFAKKHSLVFKNYRIIENVYQTLNTNDWLHCVFVCSADTRCISYNFHQKGLCELNSCAVDDMFDLNKWGVHSSGFVFQQLRDTNKDKCQTRSLEKEFKDNYALQFSRILGASGYVIIREFPSLVAFTVCFWMKTEDKQNDGTPFSYSTSGTSNELLLHNYRNFQLFIHNQKSGTTNVRATDGRWHHICSTWENTVGSWQLLKDGIAKASGTNLQKGYTISGGGVLVLGQEQDKPGGGFDQKQSFIGELTNVQLWNYVIPLQEINDLALFFLCNAYSKSGNVLAWFDIVQGSLNGSVTLIALSKC